MTLPLSLLLAACAPSTAVIPSGDCDECDDTDVVDTGTPADTDTDSDADSDSDTDTDSDSDSDSDSDADTEPLDEDGDGYVPGAADCDDTDATVYPGAAETCNGIDDDCDGAIDEALDCDDEPDEAQLELTITTPGGSVYGSMLCHVEYVEDGDNDGSITDEFSNWEYSWVENWVSETTLESDPGVIDGARLNCTLCPDELTLAEEPSSPEAEEMGCTWTAVNGSSSTNGAVATWYFDETFSSSLVSVAGGTSVLVDLR